MAKKVLLPLLQVEEGAENLHGHIRKLHSTDNVIN